MKRNRSYTPLLVTLLGIIIGIVLQSSYSLSLPTILFCLFASGIPGIILACRKTTTTCTVLLTTMFACIGATCLYFQQVDQQTITALMQAEKLTIIGTITAHETWGSDQKGTVYDMVVHEVFDWRQHQHHHLSFNLRFYLKKPVDLLVGDTATLTSVTLKKSPTETTSGNPSYHDYLV